jgi:hypothetical protein
MLISIPKIGLDWSGSAGPPTQARSKLASS